MVKAILELITVGAKIFQDERERYFQNKGKKLLEKINEVEDSTFYNKDMEAKGKAERQLMLETESLRKEFMMEALK